MNKIEGFMAGLPPSGNRQTAGLLAGLEDGDVALDRMQVPRADRIAGQQHLNLVGSEFACRWCDGKAALAGPQFDAHDAERQRGRLGFGDSLARWTRLRRYWGTNRRLSHLDLLDLGTQRQQIVIGGMATQRLFDLRDAGFQRLPGVLQARRGCGGWPLLCGLDQPGYLCFEPLQAGIDPFLVGPAWELHADDRTRQVCFERPGSDAGTDLVSEPLATEAAQAIPQMPPISGGQP